MALRKKAVSGIKKALAKVDDKAEFEAIEVEDRSINETNEIIETFVPPIELTFVSEITPNEEDRKPTINDFARTLSEEDESGISSVVEGLLIGENVVAVLKKVTLGLTEWEYKFLAAYACLPSVFCKILPIVEIYGQAGSGKSQLLIAIAKISGNGIISGQSTGASLKNHINQIRWADPESKNTEKNCLLLIDNLNEDSFKKEEYLSSFLNGYSRNTDRTYISNGKGENIEFRTFCGKIYSSIWNKDSTELSRRTITIRTQKVSDKLDESLEVEDIYWNPITTAVKAFWLDQSHWTWYKLNYRQYGKTAKPAHSKEYWTLLRDTIVTGVCAGVWCDLETAIADTSVWLTQSLKNRASLLEVIVLQALEGTLGIVATEWEEQSKRMKIHVSPRHLKDAIELAVSNGLIDRPKLSQVQQILAKHKFSPGNSNGALGYTYRGVKNDRKS